MIETINAASKEFWGKSDSETIQNAVDYAKKTGANSVTIPRFNARAEEEIWSIDRAIILPSYMEIVLDNCHLRQADGAMDNIFRNFRDPETEGHTLAEQSRSITIRGVGKAVLDGGKHNGLTEKTYKTVPGMPHHAHNHMILLYNVRDFVIENLELREHRYWAINLIHAERGRISDLLILGNCHCPNQDGIDLRIGCSNILIERIFGQTGDDVIALSAINTNTPKFRHYVENHNCDIHDIIIRDVVATSIECAVIALRNNGGNKIHDITIENVHCNDNYAAQDGKLQPEYPTYKIKPFDIVRIRKSNSPYALLRIGQPGYGGRDSVFGELYNIHATNLHMGIGCVIMANVSLENCYFGNLYADNDVDYVFTTKELRTERVYGANLRNVVIENVFYRNEDNTHATAFDLHQKDGEFIAENFFVRNAFLGNCKMPFHVNYGSVQYSGVFGKHVEKESGILTADENL